MSKLCVYLTGVELGTMELLGHRGAGSISRAAASRARGDLRYTTQKIRGWSSRPLASAGFLHFRDYNWLSMGKKLR